jgi:hypothetical protein
MPKIAIHKKAPATGQLQTAPVSAGCGMGNLRLVTHHRQRQQKTLSSQTLYKSVHRSALIKTTDRYYCLSIQYLSEEDSLWRERVTYTRRLLER